MGNEFSDHTLLRCLVKVDEYVPAKDDIIILVQQPIGLIHEVDPFVHNPFSVLGLNANNIRLRFASKEISAFHICGNSRNFIDCIHAFECRLNHPDGHIASHEAVCKVWISSSEFFHHHDKRIRFFP